MSNFLQLIIENAHLARRLGAGAMLLIVIIIVFIPTLAVESEALSLMGPFIIIAYFLGSILEIIGDVIISRLVGAATIAYALPLRKFSWLPAPSRQILIILWWILISPFALYYFCIRAMAGKDDYNIELFNHLSSEARAAFNELKDTDKIGFHFPLGLHGDHALQAIRTEINDNQKSWIDSMRHANRDVLTFSTSLMLIAFIVTYEKLPQILSDSAFLIDEQVTFLFSLVNSVSLIFMVMGIVFIYSKKRTIINVLEAYGADCVARNSVTKQTTVNIVGKKSTNHHSHGGRLFHWLVLNLLLWVNLLNIVRWNLYSNNKDEWISDSPIADLIFLRPEFLGYNLLTNESIQFVYSRAGFAAYMAILIVSIALYFRDRWALNTKRIWALGCAIFIGYLIGGLLYDGIRYAVDGYITSRYLSTLSMPLKEIGAVIIIYYVLVKNKNLDSINWKIITKIFIILLSVAIIIRFFENFIIFFQHEFGVELLSIIINALYDAGKWFAIAYALYFLHPKKKSNRAFLRLKLRKYFGLVFILSVMFVSWGVCIENFCFNGLNFNVDNLHFEFGQLILDSIAIICLWPFAKPIIYLSKRWLR